jgi:hypothetical protein
MSCWDAVGFFASSLVITAFCMKDIVQLRIVAVASNVVFLVYGLGLGLMPVWLLHLVLLPVNLWRLCLDSRGIWTAVVRGHTERRVEGRAVGHRIRAQASRTGPPAAVLRLPRYSRVERCRLAPTRVDDRPRSSGRSRIV